MHTAGDEKKGRKDMCDCNRRWCVSYKDLHLNPGEQVSLLRGIETDVPPDKVTVVKELPKMILLQLTFIRSYYPGNTKEPRAYRVCVHKGAMLCGDVILRRKKTKDLLTGEAIGTYICNS